MKTPMPRFPTEVLTIVACLVTFHGPSHAHSSASGAPTAPASLRSPLPVSPQVDSAGLPGLNDILRRSLIVNETVCDGVNGNYWLRVDRFTNTSANLRIRVDGLEVMALDPTVLGFPDVENSNAFQAQAAALAAFPEIPFWGISWWVGDDPSEVSFPFVEVDSSVSCTLGPGQSFDLTTRAHNNRFTCTSSLTPGDFGELAIGWVFSGEVFEACAGTSTAYGKGTPGSKDNVPMLTSIGCPLAGSSLQLIVEDGLAGAHGCIFVGRSEASIHVLGGTFLVSDPFDFVIMASLDELGFMTLPVNLPLTVAGQTFFLQGAFLDSGAPRGVSMTNGLRVMVEADTCARTALPRTPSRDQAREGV